MRIHHIAIWTFRLEEMKEFYVRYFKGTSNEKYVNPKKGFESYFIHFDCGADLELMSRTDVQNTPIGENRLGLTHFAFALDSKEEVLELTEKLRSAGYTISGEPRTSGDGIHFDCGADLELMSRTDVQNTPIGENRLGLTHFAFALDSKEEVLELTEKLRSAGYTISGEPRTSGDGYFESVVLDPDGNRVECVFKAG